MQDLSLIHILEMTVIKGHVWYHDGQLEDVPVPEVDAWLSDKAHHTFNLDRLTSDSFEDHRPRGVIGMVPGEIVTTDAGYASAVDISKDILKIAVIERHRHTGHIGIRYLKGYGLKEGAVATSISHDSHNIIVVGSNDADMAAAARCV